MTTRDVLVKARALIATPDRWIKGRYERKRRGRKCYCAAGTLAAAAPTASDRAWITAWKCLHQAVGVVEGEEKRNCSTPTSIENWNDDPERTHAEVLAAFDKAIASCEVSS